MGVDLGGLNRLLDSLGVAAEEAARPAAQAAAQVLYDDVNANVAKLGRVTGNLAGAVYQAFSRDNSGPGRATYHISWNAKKAPHGHLVEYGFLQRYVLYRANDGTVRPMVRPGMDGQKKPGRKASQAVKDAYYVPLPGGPRQIPAHPFVRPAVAKFRQAAAAAETELLRYMNEGPLRAGGRA
jgi:hypothetical protein